MRETTVHTCVNCGNDVTTAYCPECGQSASVKKLTFRHLFEEIQNRLFGFNGLFLRTVRDLSIDPGKVILSYIKGNRVQYYGPVGYFFLMITLWVLLLSLLDVDFLAYSNPSQYNITESSVNQQQAQQKLFELASRNQRTLSFLQIPIVAFFCWLFFRRSGFNYLEHAVLPFYVFGHIYWFSYLNLFAFKMNGFVKGQPFTIVVLLFLFLYGLINVHTTEKRWKVILKGLAALLLGYIGFIIFIMVLMIAYLVMFHSDLFIKMKS